MYSNMLVLSILAFLCSVTWAKEMPVDEVRAAELYDSGIVHESIMAAKHVCESHFISGNTISDELF